MFRGSRLRNSELGNKTTKNGYRLFARLRKTFSASNFAETPFVTSFSIKLLSAKLFDAWGQRLGVFTLIELLLTGIVYYVRKIKWLRKWVLEKRSVKSLSKIDSIVNQLSQPNSNNNVLTTTKDIHWKVILMRHSYFVLCLKNNSNRSGCSFRECLAFFCY